MNVRSHFTKPAERGSFYSRYVMPGLGLALLVWDIHWRSQLPPTYPYARYSSTVVALLFLLGSLAYEFRWPTPVTAALRIGYWFWFVFGMGYFILQFGGPD